jgi:hypothetical protein
MKNTNNLIRKINNAKILEFNLILSFNFIYYIWENN